DLDVVEQVPQGLYRRPAVGLHPAYLGEQVRQEFLDRILAHGGGQVGHVLGVAGEMGEVVRGDLLRAVAGEAEVGERFDAFGEREVGEVAGRFTPARHGEAQFG